jgi:methionine-rich copper-binding protein CopC
MLGVAEVKKKATFLIVAFLLVYASEISAHTNLNESDPSDGEVVEQALKEIHLYFETKVEQNSSFEIINSNGVIIPVNKIVVEAERLSGEFAEPLANERYDVLWKIIGTDGHPIEGEFAFTVQLSQPVEQGESEQSPQTQPGKEEPEKDTQTNPEQEKAMEQEEDKAMEQVRKTEEGIENNKVIVLIILVLALTAIVSFWWLIRRKK